MLISFVDLLNKDIVYFLNALIGMNDLFCCNGFSQKGNDVICSNILRVTDFPSGSICPTMQQRLLPLVNIFQVCPNLLAKHQEKIPYRILRYCPYHELCTEAFHKHLWSPSTLASFICNNLPVSKRFRKIVSCPLHFTSALIVKLATHATHKHIQYFAFRRSRLLVMQILLLLLSLNKPLLLKKNRTRLVQRANISVVLFEKQFSVSTVFIYPPPPCKQTLSFFIQLLQFNATKSCIICGNSLIASSSVLIHTTSNYYIIESFSQHCITNAY